MAEEFEWTVGNLKDQLEDFGDHIPVRVSVSRGEKEYVLPIDTVDLGTRIVGDGQETFLLLEVEIH